jgi:adenine-specific DNA-methyltransferase
MEDAYFGNKKVSIAQRRYLGSKTKLLSFIDSIIKTEKINFKSFADIFSGTGTVANHFHGRCKVVINDLLDSNFHIYNAFFGKKKIREKKLMEYLKRYNDWDVEQFKENYFSENFSNTYFDRINCKKIGAIRENIEQLYIKKNINEREKSYLITSLIYALDKIANTVGHYDAYRKILIPGKTLFLLPLNIVKSKYNAAIYKNDANYLVKKIKVDIVYIDPPYNSRQYSDAYHLLENIATWKKERAHGVARKIDRSHIKSKYSMKSAGIAFSDLIEHINAKYILVSYNDMGNSGNTRSQSRISDHEILSALNRRGKVKIYETNFKQFTTGKSTNNNLKERIFLCKIDLSKRDKRTKVSKKNPIVTGFVKSPLNYTGGKHKLLPQITKLFPKNITNFYDIFSGGANVGINSTAENIICIDNNPFVIELLKLIQSKNFDDLNQRINNIINNFGLSQSYIKGYKSYEMQSSTGLGKYNKDAYLKLRDEFNKNKSRYDLLLVLIFYSFNNQIRFNSTGSYNLPVGKRDYNGNSRRNLAAFNQAANDKNITFTNRDFREIEKIKFTKNDFIYLDPPYLLGLATYNEKGGWTQNDEEDLYRLLTKISKNGIRFALSNVIEHKGEYNLMLKNWIIKNNFKMHKINYNYNNSNYHSTAKNNKTTEVLVTNY